MATRTTTRVAKEKAATTKTRSDANGDLDREARAMLEEKLGGEGTKPKPRTREPAAPKLTTEAKPPATDGIDWTSKAVAAKVVKLKKAGKTIKQITQEMGLPAEQKYWMKVSIVWRREADKQGLDRPRNSAETVARRIATRKAKRAS
jgi:hypothetical protein